MSAGSLGNGFAQFPGDWTEGLARLFGGRTAIVDEKSGARITYDALASGSCAAASALRELGVRAEDGERPRVCVLAKNRVEHFEIMFACARLGALFVPLNWRLAEAELAQILDDAEPTVILADAGFFEMAKRLASSRSARALAR